MMLSATRLSLLYPTGSYGSEDRDKMEDDSWEREEVGFRTEQGVRVYAATGPL